MKSRPGSFFPSVTLILFLVGVIPIGFSQNNGLPPLQACCGSIIVNDLEKSVLWYTETLGFAMGAEFSDDERGIRIINLKQGKTRLELIETVSSIHPDSLETNSPLLQGHFKFGLRMNGFNSWMDHLKNYDPDIESRIVTDPATEKRMVVIRDPDGNRIQLFEE